MPRDTGRGEDRISLVPPVLASSPMRVHPLLRGPLEFFTLAEAEARAQGVSTAPRQALARSLILAAQKREAAEVLWPRGNVAEALCLARAAITSSSRALEAFAVAVDPLPAGIAEARASLAPLAVRIADGKPPEIDAEVTPVDEEVFRAIVDGLRAVAPQVDPFLLRPAEVASRRIRRWVTVAIVGTLLAVLLWRLLRVPVFSGAVASGEKTPMEAGKFAIDGDVTTGWYLPDHQLGWLDLTLTKARAVRTLRFANGDPPWDDRGTKDVRIVALLNGAQVKAVTAAFPEPPKKEVGWTDIAIDAPKCDHIRIEVTSFYARGAGFDEIEVK